MAVKKTTLKKSDIDKMAYSTMKKLYPNGVRSSFSDSTPKGMQSVLVPNRSIIIAPKSMSKDDYYEILLA